MTSTQSLRIVVTGLIAQHPWLGGVAWDYLQYPLGLRQLGHDVFYIEDSGEWPYTIDGGPDGDHWIADDCTANVRHLAEVMERCGLRDRWAYHFPIKSKWFGMSHARRREVIRTCDLLINVSGSLLRPADYRSAKRLVYIDSDPVFTQVKLASPRGHVKFAKRVDVHDRHFSFGEQVMGATVPRTHHCWQPTRQPIVLSEWRVSQAQRPVYTTVMNWTSYRPLRYRGTTFGQKDREFRRFLELPRLVAPVTLEVALSAVEHAKWQSTRPDEARQADAGGPVKTKDVLSCAGWRVADAFSTCGTVDSYREYIESSRGEWSVAKNGYVVGQPGWFSCRSACYLAAGRPVVVQDTGFEGLLPCGQGLLRFSTIEEASYAIREVEANYARHAAAAREIAAAHFDSRAVLTHLIEHALN